MKKFTLLLCLIALCSYSYSQGSISNVWDTINFSSTREYLKIDTSKQNIWQIASPQKTFFNSAFSETKAIITDSIKSYPINNKSYFDIYIGSFNFQNYYPYSINIGFKHKFDTDTLKDGGYITISYDKGKTWMNIINDSVYYYGATPKNRNMNLYSNLDTLFNGEKGFSGKSKNWISTFFGWQAMVVKKSAKTDIDTTIIRFNFISDNINNNKEGWLIDDITLYSCDISGVKDSKIDDLIKIYNVVKKLGL